MKKICTLGLLALSLTGFAQKGAFKLGLRLAPASNIATVRDKNATPSDVNYIADGYTVKAENQFSMGGGIYFDYFLSDNLAFSSGLWFTAKNFAIINYDGSIHNHSHHFHGDDHHYDSHGEHYANGYNYSYSGLSFYKTTYLQIPLLLKFSTNQSKKFRIYGSIGPTIDFRTGEKLVGEDRAHYWNMANNNPQWAVRDRNALGRPVKLFNPLDITLYASAGVNYEIIDKLELFLGVFVDKGFVNAINPKLRFADSRQTKVNTDISIKSFLVGAEFGVAYKLK